MSGSDRHSVAEVARILGISERGVRSRIEQGTLDAVKIGNAWRILLPPGVVPGGTAVSSASSRGTDAVVTPALVETAIARAGQQCTADLRVMLAELRDEYKGQIKAKDETIAYWKSRAQRAEAILDRQSAELTAAARGQAEDREAAAVEERARVAARRARAQDYTRQRQAATGIRRSGAGMPEELDRIADMLERRDREGPSPGREAQPWWARLPGRGRGG